MYGLLSKLLTQTRLQKLLLHLIIIACIHFTCLSKASVFGSDEKAESVTVKKQKHITLVILAKLSYCKLIFCEF
jgi:hypothetical protein